MKPTKTVLGRYDILDEIGQSASAHVYRARDTELDRLVALKEVRPAPHNFATCVKRFRQEVKLLTQVNHPHIVKIYDVHEKRGRLFIVMRLVDGPDLKELIARQGYLPWAKALAITTAVAEGLDCAHQHRILHQNLKPANILIDRQRGPMLSDFCLNKLVDLSSTRLSSSGDIVGPAHYYAPEVWEGHGTSRQSDIYALGCILYEMLTGDKAFKGNTAAQVVKAHFCPLKLPEVWPEGVPVGVADVLRTALAKNRDDRYQTAGEMARAVRDVFGVSADENLAHFPLVTGASAPKVEAVDHPTGPINADGRTVRAGSAADDATAWSSASGTTSDARDAKKQPVVPILVGAGAVIVVLIVAGLIVAGLVASFARSSLPPATEAVESAIAQATAPAATATAEQNAAIAAEPATAQAATATAIATEPATAVTAVAETHLNRGYAYYDTGDLEQAIAEYSQAIALDPGYAAAYEYRGYAYYAAGNLEQAIQDHTQAIELEPDNAVSYGSRGFVYSISGDLEQAIQDCTKAIELDPGYAQAYSNRGAAYVFSGEYELAKQDCTKAIELEPDNGEAYNNRGLAYYHSGNLALAIQDYSNALELEPSWAEVYKNRGLAYAGSGDLEQAIEDYSNALELEPAWAEAYNDRGLAYVVSGNLEQAIADWTQAIELDPDYAQAYYNRGVAYANSGDYDQALADYSKAIELNPNYAQPYTNRGVAYANLGNLEQALADYSKAIELEPNNVKVYAYRGTAHADLGNLEQAIADLTKVIELDPNLANAYYNRGAAHYESGDLEQAIADFEQYLELAPDAPDREEVITGIEEMKSSSR